MNRSDLKSPDTSDEVSPEILAAYQAASRMIAYEGQLTWRITSVFVSFGTVLIAGAVFPSFIGSKNPGMLAVAGFVVSVIGVVSSLAWSSMVGRSRKYYHYWIGSARELERHLPDSVCIFCRGEKFAAGDSVKVDGKSLRFSSIERINMRTTLLFLYAAYLAAFLFLLAANFYKIIMAF